MQEIFDKWLPNGVKGVGLITQMANDYESVRIGSSSCVIKNEYLSLLGAIQQLIDVRTKIMDVTGTAAAFTQKSNTI